MDQDLSGEALAAKARRGSHILREEDDRSVSMTSGWASVRRRLFAGSC